MLTGKQKRFLRALGTELDPIFQIGKGGLNDNLFRQLNDAVEARELIKVRVLSNSEENPREAANTISQVVGCEVVQVVGRNMIFYKRSEKKPKIELP
ncbi:MAG: ribosome assembly RNA-binding protein YhbY [Desulfitobacteriaceae bacterium]|nr:ribosome assembly RNA-binding protein YhbY [Desulfitobacteriaceae bacterium]MDD4752834.1 ribosome assembly RNA-binding protein YhbY [Desulfitobacteriaceae bacterium]